MTPLDKKQRKILTYTLYGFILGSLIPIASTVSELTQREEEFSLSFLRTMHSSHPLLIIIYLVPIVMAASFALIAFQSARYHEAQLSQMNIQKFGPDKFRMNNIFSKRLLQAHLLQSYAWIIITMQLPVIRLLRSYLILLAMRLLAGVLTI